MKLFWGLVMTESILSRWCKWLVEHASHARDLSSNPVWSRLPSLKKISHRSVNHRALFPTSCGLSQSRMYLTTAQGYLKKHSDSCSLAWLEMIERSVLLQLLLLTQKEVELFILTVVGQHFAGNGPNGLSYYYYYYYYYYQVVTESNWLNFPSDSTVTYFFLVI